MSIMGRVVFSFGGGLTSFFGAIETIKQYGASNVTVVNAALLDDEPYVKPVMDAFTAYTGVPVKRISAINPALDSIKRMLVEAEAERMSPQLMRWLIDALKKQGRSRYSVDVVDEPRYSVWHVFFLAAILGNSRLDPCSDQLKRQVLRRWITANYDPETTAIAVGMTSDEMDRHLRTAQIWGGAWL